MKDQTSSESITTTLDTCITHYDNHVLVSDINDDILCPTKGKTLLDIIDLFDLSHLVKEPTCFLKKFTSYLLDVMLTNKITLCMDH